MAKQPIRITTRPQLPTRLKTVSIDPSTLFRVSGHSTGEPYFGKWNANRFDDPSEVPEARYGTCYLGTSLAVAIAETLLHDRKPIKSWFVVELAVIKSRYVIQFKGSPLTLADLTGAELKRLGGNAALSGTASYGTTKQWSQSVHQHADKVDGMLYMSRHKNDEKAIVMFDRAAHKLSMTKATRLHEHPDFGQVATDLYIRSSYP
jgi:hypothetical protein